jgi:MFS family permease
MLLGTFMLRVSTAVTGGLLFNFINEITVGHRTGPAANALLTGGFYTTELTGAIVFGILADRYGRKLIMLVGPILGGVAVFMTGLTTHVPILFVTRLLEGGSTAASIPSTLGFIAAETAHDERLRGRVVSLFELVSLGGMLAVGPAVAGELWVRLGRSAFFINCFFYLAALVMYAYGVSEVKRERRASTSARQTGRTFGAEVSRYLRMATNRRVLLFTPTWLSINAILGLWAIQAPLLLRGNIIDPSQYLMRDLGATNIGYGMAGLAVVFGIGILVWGSVYARFRRSTMIMVGVGAFVVMGLDILAINHLGGTSEALLYVLAGVAVAALFVMSGATPAALGLLADVSEGFEEDRSAIMGLYSVFLGLGQVIGAVIGGLAATWKGIDGMLVATAGLLFVGIVALSRLRASESEILLNAVKGPDAPASIHQTIRDTLPLAGGGRQRPSEAAVEDEQ